MKFEIVKDAAAPGYDLANDFGPGRCEELRANQKSVAARRKCGGHDRQNRHRGRRSVCLLRRSSLFEISQSSRQCLPQRTPRILQRVTEVSSDSFAQASATSAVHLSLCPPDIR